jgi:hypothetical protein
MAQDRLRNGLIRFRVRITRIVTKDVEVQATDIYKAQQIGRSMAEKHDWTDIDTLAYSSLAEPWSLSEERRKKSINQQNNNSINQ